MGKDYSKAMFSWCKKNIKYIKCSQLYVKKVGCDEDIKYKIYLQKTILFLFFFNKFYCDIIFKAHAKMFFK